MLDQEKAAEFIASAGMLMAAVDGKVDPVEEVALRQALSNFTSSPEKYLYFNDWDSNLKRVTTSCSYIAGLDDFTKNIMLGLILGIAFCDGELHKKEKNSLYKIAELMKIDKEIIDLNLAVMLEILQG